MIKLNASVTSKSSVVGRRSLKLLNPPELDSVYEIYIRSLAPSGRSGIRSLLSTCANRLQPSYTADKYPWQCLTYACVSKLRAELLDAGYSVASVNLALAALRGLARVAFNMGYLTADELSRIHAVRRVKGSAARKGRSLEREEVKALLAATKQSSKNCVRARDKALILVSAGAGLRAAELVSLAYDDFDPRTGILRVLHGKGRKQRTIHLARPVQTALKAWLKHHVEKRGPLFTKISRAGQPADQALSKPGLTDIFNRVAAKAEVARFTPHDLRRTFITHLLDAGVDINTVRQLAGHSNIATTAAYDYRSEKAKITASRAFSCW
ncbi:MAG: site-specific integrase [Pseudomonadota bacterium]|nr:integrase [Pseudohongiella sp.]MEC8859903.1 site-specific integrase [Pseudomonadota bacterium]|tara:strand:+ start:6503 stop:7477 length:975 start_codon:yes stop_codon:yes gene_type:complete